MQVTPVATHTITRSDRDLLAILDRYLPALQPDTVVAVASNVVAMCEGRLVDPSSTEKDVLIASESEQYLPRTESRYNVSFTITRGRLVPTAGIDESNGDGQYVLWPEDPQRSANAIRAHLAEHHGVDRVGVVITDSTTAPLRWGVTGMALASSGFNPIHDYIGSPDLFGRLFTYEKANIAAGLAAAATLVMGEGDEGTPLAVITDLPFVEFQQRDPTPAELDALVIDPADDLYWPLLQHAPWRRGGAAR